jgi:hypothetical protein
LLRCAGNLLTVRHGDHGDHVKVDAAMSGLTFNVTECFGSRPARII